MKYWKRIFPFFLLGAAIGQPPAAPCVDFIIIGDPVACKLFDQYEQPLSAEWKKTIARNAPFEIVNERQPMGDQITQAMRLSHLASTYYLMLDDKGKPAGLPSTSSAVRYRGCTPYYDTVIVTLPSLRLTERHPAGGAVVTLKKGETIIRIFGWRGTTFLCRQGKQPFYGWSNAPKSAFRMPEKKSADQPDDFSMLHTRIMKRFADVNERYDSLFRFFNTITGQQKAIPHWDYSLTGNRHVYALKGSDATVSQLETSTRHILADIEYILLGKPFAALYRDGAITIGPR
ncbi:MAG: hypothetical protein JW913_13890 [Chitinispirillaceae bacterium]|nr:hypothetical protein [Chitinispirillaceae bacterium]